jgi:hypothetical protein
MSFESQSYLEDELPKPFEAKCFYLFPIWIVR